MLECRENARKCDVRMRRIRRGIAGIWQCLLATFLLSFKHPCRDDWYLMRWQISRRYETPVPRWLVPHLLGTIHRCWDDRVGCRLHALKYDGHDSLHRKHYQILILEYNTSRGQCLLMWYTVGASLRCLLPLFYLYKSPSLIEARLQEWFCCIDIHHIPNSISSAFLAYLLCHSMIFKNQFLVS